MDTSKQCITNKAFIKKYFHFIKYYPLRYKDPAVMLKNTILHIIDIVNRSSSLAELTPVSKEIRAMMNLLDCDSLYQEEVIDEKGSYILYKPLKFLNPGRRDSVIVEIYNLISIPSN